VQDSTFTDILPGVGEFFYTVRPMDEVAADRSSIQVRVEIGLEQEPPPNG